MIFFLHALVHLNFYRIVMTTDATLPLLQILSYLSLLFTITHNTKMIYFNEQSTLLWHAFHIQLIHQIQLNRVEDRDSGGDWREGQKRRSELNALTYWRCVFNKGHTGQNRAINLPVSLGTDTKSALQFWVLSFECPNFIECPTFILSLQAEDSHMPWISRFICPSI